METSDDDLRNRLREATKQGDLAAVRKLLDRGVNPHWSDVANHQTLYHYAVLTGNARLISEFMKAGLTRYPNEE